MFYPNLTYESTGTTLTLELRTDNQGSKRGFVATVQGIILKNIPLVIDMHCLYCLIIIVIDYMYVLPLSFGIKKIIEMLVYQSNYTPGLSFISSVNALDPPNNP